MMVYRMGLYRIVHVMNSYWIDTMLLMNGMMIDKLLSRWEGLMWRIRLRRRRIRMVMILNRLRLMMNPLITPKISESPLLLYPG
jgi:hypothetical protein